MSTRRNSVFADLVDRSGFFDGDPNISIISKNQQRKFYRYNELSITGFFRFLAESDIIRKRDIPDRRGMTLGDVLDFLLHYRYRTEQARSDGNHIYEAILTAEIPFLARSFAKGDFNWINLELYGVKRNRSKGEW